MLESVRPLRSCRSHLHQVVEHVPIPTSPMASISRYTRAAWVSGVARVSDAPVVADVFVDNLAVVNFTHILAGEAVYPAG